MPPLLINAWAVIMIKAGQARGRQTLKLRPEAPSGFQLPEVSLPVLLEGEDRGVHAILSLSFQAASEGLYWFDALLEDRLLTRLPLRVVYEALGTGTLLAVA